MVEAALNLAGRAIRPESLVHFSRGEPPRKARLATNSQRFYKASAVIPRRNDRYNL